MKRTIFASALFSFSLCLLTPATYASTVTLKVLPSSGSPYNFEVNGTTLEDLSCLNYNRTVTTGESWTATDVNLETLIQENPVNTNNVVVGGISIGDLKADAYLDSQYTSNPTSITNTEIQDAIWSVLDNHDEYYGLNTFAEDQAVRNYVTIAESTTETSAFYSQFTYYYPDNWSSDCGIPQQFMGYSPTVTPEPSSLILLGTGLAGLAGALRRRMTLQKSF